MNLTLAPPSPADLHDLFAFECDNRSFFEGRINARPASYYSLHGVAEAIEAAIRDAAEDKGYQFLARDDQGRLIGRVNLNHVRRAHYYSAELGYRIGQACNGRGPRAASSLVGNGTTCCILKGIAHEAPAVHAVPVFDRERLGQRAAVADRLSQ